MFKAPFYSLNGVVASEHPLASYIGVKVLEKGGNAVDAAIATSLALAVTLPHLGGLGGDFFALVEDNNGAIKFVNGSGYAPSKLSISYMNELGYRSMPLRGPLIISIPGLVDGLYQLWRIYGSIEWKKLVDFASKIARKGFPISKSLAKAISILKDELSKDYGWRATYLINGSIPSEGTIIKFPGLAKALELISEDPREFYEGDLARAITNYVNKRGGVLELHDLKHYHAEIGNAISIRYRDAVIYEMPPNTQGITTLHILSMLNNVELPISPKSSKRILELLKIAKVAYMIRDLFITDPRYMTISVDKLLSRDFIKWMMSLTKYVHRIHMNRRSTCCDTTYFAIADSEGMIVSGIQSLFYAFGSGIVEPLYQIPLNSRASDFSLNKSHINRLEPRKKTMHTLSATIIHFKNRRIAFGLSGGHYRPLLQAQIITNIIDYGMNTQEAIEFPRFIWEIDKDVIRLEEGLEINNLSNYGFRSIIQQYPSRLGVAAAVEIKPNGIKCGYTDIRGDGIAIGTYN